MTFYLITSLLFAGFTIGLLYMMRHVRGHTFEKVSLSAAFVGMSCYVAFSFASILGNPTFQQLPPKAQLLWVDQREVDGKELFSLWLSLPGVPAPPRAYKVVPTDEERKALRGARRDLMAGRVVMIEAVKGEPGGSPGEPRRGRGTEGGGQGGKSPGDTSGDGPFIPNSGNGFLLRMPTMDEMAPVK